MRHDPVAGTAARARAESVEAQPGRSRPAGGSEVGAAGRAAVLGRIGRALGRDSTVTDPAAAPEAVRARLAGPTAHTRPFVGEDLVGRAVRLMEEVLMDVVRLQTRDGVAEAVRDWLEGQGAHGPLTVAPALADIDFPTDFPHPVRRGGADGVEATSVTPCLAAVAETGSVVFASTGATPATLNFLPENHVVVLHEDQIVRHVDDVFPAVRRIAAERGRMPRAVNFVTGPSRTADVEQTLEIGAHGPKRMLVLLLPGGPPDGAPEALASGARDARGSAS